MAFTIKFRRDTEADWAARNPLLAEGEPGYELDTLQWKIGDGLRRWNSLPYRANRLTDEQLAEIADQVREELEVPEIQDLVLLWENAKA